MSQPISRLWFVGPPFAILVSLLAYYAKFPSMRHWVDARFPWVEVNIGRHLPELTEESSSRSRSPRKTIPPRSPTALTKTSSAEPGAAPPAPPAPPSYFTADGSVDVAKLAANPSAWPTRVTLKKARQFPAVVSGKTMGMVELPAGTEARLRVIQDGKLGLEYQGGGAWLSVEETDLAQRLAH